ncbi:MAG: class I tRNA ligase family protein, partial [Candidatus Moranbacteria bacterium]|nr:class I tRNA ligase family protein [Candidatus Moranbacteria bacterium]
GTLWNSYSFFVLYASVDKWQPKKMKPIELLKKGNILDKWLLAELSRLTREINAGFEKYLIVKAAKKLEKFVDNLSNWYIRRSRRRFWKSESDDDKNSAYQTLWLVLTELSKLMAPYCPFIADEIFKNLTGKESVHLEKFPEMNEKLLDEKVISEMERVRKIIETGLSLRAENGIKVRQPLSRLIVESEKVNQELENLLKEEVNVKEVCWKKQSGGELAWKKLEGFQVGLDI